MTAKRAALLSCLILLARDASAAPYALWIIADLGNAEGFVLGSSLSINEQGQVAFLKYPNGSTSQACYRGEGQGLTTIAAEIDIFSQAGANSITWTDEVGNVTFVGSIPPGGPLGVLTGSGGPVSALVGVSASLYNFVLLGANDVGQVAFVAGTPTGFVLERRESNATLTPLAAEGANGIFTTGRYQLPINHSGVVASWVQFDNGTSGIGRTDQAGLQTIVTQGPNFVPRQQILDLDDAGTVLFLATPSASSFNGNALYRASGGAPVVAMDSTGPFAFFLDAALNGVGDLVFQANLDTNAANSGGIFVGPDPVADKVLEVGDALARSQVSLVNLGDINNAGQIALFAELADGRDLVLRADPVPEPGAALAAAVAIAFVAGAGSRSPPPASRFLARGVAELDARRRLRRDGELRLG